MSQKTDYDFLDIENFLGSEFAAYKDELYTLSISQPSQYAKLRATVMREVRGDMVKNMYKTLYDIMLNGKVNGRDVIKTTGPGAKTYVPSIPKPQINKFAVSSAEAIDEILVALMDTLLPKPFSDTANSQLAKSGMVITEAAPAT